MLATTWNRVPVRECPRWESDLEYDHCLMADERNRDALRGYFELFKHLSTVSTAILVIVLVLYRDLYLDSVLASFYGMFVAMNHDLSPPGGSPVRYCGGFCMSPWALWAALCSA